MSNKEAIARKLAEAHFAVEPEITQIFTLCEKSEIEALPGTPIKLLEVNAATIPSGVMPLHFGPAPASGIPYSSVIIEVTPSEFEQIKANELKLPDGWTIGAELPKPPHLDEDE
jgi:hypothetical protein